MNDAPNLEVVIFTEAIQLPADQRAGYLEHACGGDAKLRQRVEALLLTHESVGDFLEESPQKKVGETLPGMVAGEKVGDCIGRYKLLQQIGEGGWGVVFLAEQKEPVHRRVALKIIKPGMDTKNVIARFEAERQALALMDHPNIAQVYDAGATRSGRPYFVMQLVRGVKITEYCDQHSLSTDERLRLFIQVCHAIQHAHQKGIIHRDIKPSNILVTTTLHGEAMPVVIDFGIAKATTTQQLTDKTLFTAFDMLIGTPAYMSPEQAAFTSVDVDTRTDIYSLGVLLYELLTGSTPFDAAALLKTGLDEIRRVIREQEPVRPSTRLSKLTEADLTTIANRRNSEPPLLIRVVRGDLDWIAMKALEKDRTRRYETAYGMALDVQRYLCNEPISARPPSTVYKFQKTVLRNKLFFMGLAFIALVLVLGLIIVSASLAKERQARREADAALQQAEADKAKAQTEAVKSRQVTQFLEKMLQGVGPAAARGQDTTMLRCILDRTAESVGDEMTNQPAVEAELRGLIGRLYFEIGNYDQAEKMQRAALVINQRLFGPRSLEAAGSLNDLGEALWKEAKLSDAEAAHQEALAVRRQLLGNESAEVAASLSNLADVLRHQQRTTEAEALTREALGIRQKRFGNDSLEAADSLRSLSILLGDEGKRTEAEAIARQVLAIRRERLGSEDPLVASALGDVAWAATGNGKLDEAGSLRQEALVMQRKLLGDEHPDVTKNLNFIGQLMARQGNRAEAHAVLKATLSIQSKLLGEDDPATLDTMRSLGLVLESEGNFADAETVHRAALRLWLKRGQGGMPQAVDEAVSLTHILMGQKRYAEAEQILNEVLVPAVIAQTQSGDLLALRADLEARRGEWQKSAADTALAFDHQPAKDGRYSMLAALLVKTHDLPAYEQLRHKLLSMTGVTTNIYAADQVAKACLFLPPSETELPVISRLADLTVTRGANDRGAMPFFEVCKALSEYRQGHFAEAVEWARKPLGTPDINVHGHDYAVLAMAYWRLGDKEMAQTMLAEGNKLAPTVLPEQDAMDPGNAWLAWIFARVTLDEAAALIQPGLTPAESSGKP